MSKWLPCKVTTVLLGKTPSDFEYAIVNFDKVRSIKQYDGDSSVSVLDYGKGEQKVFVQKRADELYDLLK